MYGASVLSIIHQVEKNPYRENTKILKTGPVTFEKKEIPLPSQTNNALQKKTLRIAREIGWMKTEKKNI